MELLTGRHAPDVDLPCTRPTAEHDGRFRLADQRGRWVLLLFFPHDFAASCPAELIALSSRFDEFEARECSVVAVSVDSLEEYERWLAPTAMETRGVGRLRFPLASDEDGFTARRFGVYDDREATSLRGLFIIDPGGVVQLQQVSRFCLGRGTAEPLALLDALRRGGGCPHGWSPAADGRVAAAALEPGDLLAHYRVLERVGIGAFSEVFRARDTRLEREVALKALRPGHTVDLDHVLHEARAAAALSHPNICTVFGVEHLAGVPSIVMELLAGDTLASRIARGPMILSDTVGIARSIGSALSACHSAGIVHGDLKPGNVMFTLSGTPKVLDFGVAKREGRQVLPAGRPTADATVSDTLFEPVGEPGPVEGGTGPTTWGRDLETCSISAKRKSYLVGTPAYMAPELLEGEPASPESDVFAFGVMMFEMATGHVPIETPSWVMLLREMYATDLREVVQLVPEPLHMAVGRALARHPGARVTMAELLQML